MRKPLNEQFRRMQKLAGIITENQGDSSEISLTPEVKTFIDKAIQSSISRGDMEKLQKAGYWEGDFPDYILDKFGADFPEAYRLSKEVEDYIQDAAYVTENVTNMNEEDDMDDLKVEFLPEYEANEAKDAYYYHEKGLADGFVTVNGKTAKEIIGYFEDEDGNEDIETIGYVYSKSGKNIKTEYSKKELQDAFYKAVGAE